MRGARIIAARNMMVVERFALVAGRDHHEVLKDILVLTFGCSSIITGFTGCDDIK